MKYDQMSVFESIVAKSHVRIEIDVPGEGGRGWRRSASSFELDSHQDLGEAWRKDLQAGTAYMLQETLVKANDAHMDAKVVRETAKMEQPLLCMATGPYVFSPRQGLAMRASLRHWFVTRRAWQRRHAEVRPQQGYQHRVVLPAAPR